jgi:hypothetical protein
VDARVGELWSGVVMRWNLFRSRVLEYGSGVCGETDRQTNRQIDESGVSLILAGWTDEWVDGRCS